MLRNLKLLVFIVGVIVAVLIFDLAFEYLSFVTYS